jgi:hypothetical protein
MDSDTRTRLFEEYSQLLQRVTKLEKFLTTEQFAALPQIDRDDLAEQLRHMRAYHKVLSRRVGRQCARLISPATCRVERIKN